jgi:hypothetical protein
MSGEKMENIKIRVSNDIVKKILGNVRVAKLYLDKIGVSVTKTMKADAIWAKVVQTWDYDVSKTVVRELFCETLKYQNGKSADEAMQILLEEWLTLQLGPVEWPFTQSGFDDFVQRINSECENGLVKDEKVKAAAVKYRRIKEINTVRNDFIETLIFEKNENIIPTLGHRRGLDFFVDGISYDQKVSRSVTNEFKRDYRDDWRQTAIEHPELVAEYLYTYQDEGRFGNEPRLLVVYLDENISIQRIRDLLLKTNIESHTEITFSYTHKNIGIKTYKVPCFVILLYNES